MSKGENLWKGENFIWDIKRRFYSRRASFSFSGGARVSITRGASASILGKVFCYLVLRHEFLIMAYWVDINAKGGDFWKCWVWWLHMVICCHWCQRTSQNVMVPSEIHESKQEGPCPKRSFLKGKMALRHQCKRESLWIEIFYSYSGSGNFIWFPN